MEGPSSYKINEYITLKLENGKTNIYVKGRLFIQYKSVLLNNPVKKISSLDEIESIDEAVEIINGSQEKFYYFNNEELKFEELSNSIFYIWVFLSILRDEIFEHYQKENENAPFYDWNLDETNKEKTNKEMS